jgi:hypothetical protein
VVPGTRYFSPGTRYLELGTAQRLHELMLLNQHGEQQYLEGGYVRRVPGGSQVAVCSGEEFVQDELVLPAQGAAEAGQGGLFFLEKLGGGG